MSLVKVENIVKRFGPLEVLKQVSLEVEQGQIVAVIGRSGSGKSTLLRCLNALEPVQAGRIVVDGIEVTAPEADHNALRARVGMVFQSYNLFPHLNVADNIGFALHRWPKSQRQQRIRELADLLALEDLLPCPIRHISGGQAQRVAKATASTT